MSTITSISQKDFTDCNFSTASISNRIEPAEYSTSTLNTKTTLSSYRKSYIAWDKLERANKPDNYTEKTKYLSKNAKALLSVVYQKLKKQPVLLLTHKYISTITCSGSRQNQNIVRELGAILDISYHRSAEDHKGKRYEYAYKFIHKTNKKETLEKNVIRKKISASNAFSTYIRENNLIKNRSRANFKTNYSSDRHFNIQTNSKIRRGKNKPSNDQDSTCQVVSDNSLPYVSKNTKKQVIANNSTGFLGSGKFLSEMLEDLTEDICELIRSNSGRNFTNRAIKEIVKAVSRSKKGSKAFFYHIKGFIAYLSKILRYEKRDPEKINGDNYYITSNQTQEEQDMKKQEKYLSEIEYSLQVSPEWHLKKKLAAVLERNKAYDILRAFKSIDIRQNKALITVDRYIELSTEDKNIILNQIRATHERVDDKGSIKYVESLKIIMSNRSTAFLNPLSSTIELDQGFFKREGIWGKVREKFATLEGDAIEKSWIARLKANIDKNNNTINLIAPTPFIRDWVNSNYLLKLESIAKDFGYNIDSIRL